MKNKFNETGSDSGNLKSLSKSQTTKSGSRKEQIVTIKGEPVIDIYESFNGSFWFVTEKSHKQDSIINGKVYENDQILFGYARLSACPEFAEFGYISEIELKLLGPRVWKVPKANWHICPEVEVVTVSDEADVHINKSKGGSGK